MDSIIQKYMAFIKTVEYSSFTRAAEALLYTQSGISRMINDLEREWNVTLLERSRAGVRLTSDGIQLLPYVRKICDEYTNLQLQVDRMNGLQSGLIRIGTFSSVATHWLPGIIREFQKDYPNIDYELLLGDYAEIETWILAGRVDCGFLIEPVNTELESIFLEEDPLCAILPKDHPLAAQKTFPLSQISNERFMLLEKDNESEISDLLRRHGVDLKPRFTTWDDYAIMSMVENGLGMSILPQLILRRLPYDIAVKPLEPCASRRVCLALRNIKTASMAVKKFIEYLDYR